MENDHNASDSNLLFLHLPLVVGVAFAVLTVLSDVSSAPRFLVDVFSFVVHAEFEVGILQSIFISQTTDFHFANYRICTIPILYFVLKFKFRQFELRLVNENNACKLAFARVGPKGIDVNGSKRLSPTPSVSNLNLRPGR